MSENIENRKFKLWDYNVSHGMALLRSHSCDEHSLNIDIIFVGVKYIALPEYMNGIFITEPTEQEMEHAKNIVGSDFFDEQVFVLSDKKHRHLIVAHSMRIQENNLDLFEYPYS